MGLETVKGSLELAVAVKMRRNELGLTIENATSTAASHNPVKEMERDA